jgi:hypothetical protein
MDISTFYGFTSATCFTLVGLWWSVVQGRPAWRTDEAQKRLAGGVYASFLIPGLMSLAAQIGVESPLVATGAGLVFSSRLIQMTRAANPHGAFNQYAWVVPVLYALMLFFAVFAGLAWYLGLEPLQLEALILSGLILCAHMLAWEFSTSA